MKNRITQLSILGLLATAVVSYSSCRKEEPPATTNNGTGLNGTGTGNGTGGTTVNGCTDSDSPLYNSSANNNDGTCKYVYTTSYEISYHPEKDNGSVWDFGIGNATKADLILKIKEVGASNYIFEGDEKTNQDHNTPAVWAAPSAVKLKNKTYEWVLEDYDATSGNDIVSQGTFNPITAASNGVISTIGQHPTSGEQSRLKITYNLQ